MSDNYQQEQAGWEWRDQEDERWHVENIRDYQDDVEKLVVAKPILDKMLSSFNGVLSPSKESI